MSVIGLGINCPIGLAGFWSEVLGSPVNPGVDPQNAAIDATGAATGMRLAFHKVPEPKTVKNWLHLDLVHPAINRTVSGGITGDEICTCAGFRSRPRDP
jgi:hypothetical protein